MTIDQISNDFVRDLAALSPLAAVYLGLPSDRLLDDLSPDGLDEQADLVRRTLAAASQQPIGAERRPRRRRRAHGATPAAPRPLRRRRLPLGAQRHRLAAAGPPHAVRPAPQGQRRRLSPTSRRGCGRVPEAFAGYAESLRRGRPPRPGVGGPPGRQVRRAVRHLLRGRRRSRLLRDARRCEASAPEPSPRSWRRRRRSPTPRTPTSPRSCGRSCASTHRRRTRSAARCTRWRRATSSAPPSTSRRRTTGDGRSSSGWRPSSRRCARASARERRRVRSPTSSTTTPATRSPAPTGCSAGCSSCPTTPSPSSAGPTSTSPSDPHAGLQDRPAWRAGRRLLHGAERRPVAAGSDVVVGRAGPRGVLDVARGDDRVPRGRSRTSPADRHGGATSASRSTTSSGCSPARAGTPKGGRSTPSG